MSEVTDARMASIDNTDRENSGHVHPAIGHADILDVIMDICEAEKEYDTIFSMVLLSKQHRAIVQSRLHRIRKRVVLNLDDYQWRDEGNDGNIEYVLLLRCQTL